MMQNSRGYRLNDFVPKLILHPEKHQQVIKELESKSSACNKRAGCTMMKLRG
jgi:hypothetical protein